MWWGKPRDIAITQVVVVLEIQSVSPGSGWSTLEDSEAAGREAAHRATDHAPGVLPGLVVLFASVNHDLERLLAGAREVVGEVPLVGCSGAGEIGAGGPIFGGCSLMALYGGDHSFSVAVAEGASENLREAGASVARGAIREANLSEEYPHRAFLMLTDALSGDQREIISGAYEVLGAEVPLVGGSAGDDLKARRTYQFCGDRVLTDSVVGVFISSRNPLGIGVRHGWRQKSRPYTVTRAYKNVVYELDGEPALEVYEREVGENLTGLSREEFVRKTLVHPLGIPQLRGEPHIRHVIGNLSLEEGDGLVTFAEVPQNSLVQVMHGDQDSVLLATRESGARAVEQLGGRTPCAALVFDCAARYSVLGDDSVREVEILRKVVGGETPLAGFYTFGEIARLWGVAGFHNETIVTLVLS